MADEQKSEAVPVNATITFDIPAYVDQKSGKLFQKILIVPTKKAYAVYKRLVEKQDVQ